jgi:hypothetical protein
VHPTRALLEVPQLEARPVLLLDDAALPDAKHIGDAFASNCRVLAVPAKVLNCFRLALC